MINITPQAMAVYRLLSKKESLTAKEISTYLGILPNAIYRSVKILIRFGFVQIIGGRPVRYVSRPLADSIGFYMHAVRKNLLQSLSSINQSIINNSLDVTFISDRTELIEKTNIDMTKANKEVNLIVSGLEVPAETMLENKNAINRGVRIRIIVQSLDETKKEMLKNWQKIGIEVKYCSSIEARFIIFDSKIAYITSYNPKQKEEGSGVRFNYPPIAGIIQDLFEQRWSKAKVIK